jgi:tetratricopeptide (TPR) repeat protein
MQESGAEASNLQTMMKPEERYSQIQERYEDALTKHHAGEPAKATELLREVVLRFAAFEAEFEELRHKKQHLLQRAEACERCGDYLMESGEIAEAVNLYQEAVDVFGRVLGGEGEEASARCATKTVEAIQQLSRQPQDRLQLLLIRYERQIRQLQLHGGTSHEQATLHVEVAQILLRRERYAESQQNFQRALRLYEMGNPDASNAWLRGKCHHQLGNFALYHFEDLPRATRHYESALLLFGLCETLEEYDPSRADVCRRALEEIAERNDSVSIHFPESCSGF